MKKQIIEERTNRLVHMTATDKEYSEIIEAIKKAQKTDLGKILHGDMVRMIMLEWARGR